MDNIYKLLIKAIIIPIAVVIAGLLYAGIYHLTKETTK